jgi:hypothetical protein
VRRGILLGLFVHARSLFSSLLYVRCIRVLHIAVADEVDSQVMNVFGTLLLFGVKPEWLHMAYTVQVLYLLPLRVRFMPFS